MYIKNCDPDNFANENTISCVSSSLNELISELEQEGNIATQRFRDNSMIANPDSDNSKVSDNNNWLEEPKNNIPQKLTINEKVITSSENVTLLGLEVDSKLNFDEHISKLCNKSTGQLNALCKLGPLIGLEERKILLNSFIYVNFNYRPLLWYFSSRKTIKKIENIQKKALRFFLNDYSSDFKTLFKKTSKCTMEVKQLRVLALEIFKAFNENCPTFIKNYFEKNENSVSKKYELKIPIRNSVTFGDNSLRSLAPRVWNSLPKQLKTETSFVKFKEEIDKWFGPKCKCSLCSYIKPV